ncbi:hypothetical protein PYW08_014291 [Mythimna loreyi]|uniref:Uncharacterized protein n=1 Tax=Mythimna loreyi TaxID=667449 RepID=A0ACC2R7E6_9NEOP|nr:hypothetical protein PYW08_014291 [Mythimna loreyi]
MARQETNPFLTRNKLLLPEQPIHDDFLDIMEKVFSWSSLFGVFGCRKYISIIWCIIILSSLVIIEFLAIWKVIRALAGVARDMSGHRSITARFAGTIFYLISIFSLITASKLCYNWRRNISIFWAKTERSVGIKLPDDSNLKKRIHFVVGFMTFFSIFEHVVSIVASVGFDCPPSLLLKRYILVSHGFIFMGQDYSEWFAIPLLLQAEAVRVYTWRKIREAYVKQAMLVRKIDVALGGIIILSFSCNFYFICLQMFLGITQGFSTDIITGIYYVISLAWLCIRVASVVLAAAEVNTQSKIAVKYLYTYDTHCYNVERLQDQLTKDYIALSGMGFFYLNKTILLQMLGAIITYELVLIEFDEPGSNDVQLGNITTNI